MGFTAQEKARSNELSKQIIGVAIEVHRLMGPGLLESAYEECLCRELFLRSIPFERQVRLPLEYKGIALDCGYKMDIVVGGLVVLELKSAEALDAIHEAQLLKYLRLSQHWLGLLINFNVLVLRDGLKRLVQG